MKVSVGIMMLALAGSAFAKCPVAPINGPSEEAKKLAIHRLSEFMKCDPGMPENEYSPCNYFASRGLKSIWGVNDFSTGDNSFLTANQMQQKVNAADSAWIKLGGIFDEDNNLCAQSLANGGWPVIALLADPTGHGHVALVIPGEPQESSTWGILAANSASFLLNKPGKAYINKPLSNAFSKPDAQSASFYYRMP